MTTKHKRPIPTMPVEEIAHYPLPGMAIPSSISFLPDGHTITYLYSPDHSLTQYLYRYDFTTGEQTLLAKPPGGGITEQNISKDEALRRERQRVRNLGITSYSWNASVSNTLIPLRGNLYLLDEENELKQIFDCQGSPALDSRFSPDGKWISFVRNAEVIILSMDGKELRQLTHDAAEKGVTHGLAEYIAQEEMDRSQGYWWSPDSQKIAFTEVDERHIPIYRIMHQGKAEIGTGAQEDHHYPFAGQENAHIRLGVVNIDHSDVTWMDLGESPDIYLARVNWLSKNELVAQIENREQTELKLVRFDLESGAASVLLTETSEIWINLHNMLRPIEKIEGIEGGGFLWASERTGFRHLYLYTRRGELIRPLTAGDWMVDALVAVDEDHQLVYFTATAKGPLESHLYVVSFSGGEMRKITTEAGMHSIVIDPSCKQFVDTWNSIQHPPRIALKSLQDGGIVSEINLAQDISLGEEFLKPPELVEITNRSGVRLYGAIYRPPSAFGTGPYPTIVQVYGGPHAQQVSNQWGMTVNMRAQYLRSLGFLVFILDNRGSARRGLAFEGVIRHDMGHFEVEDQVDGVRWLVEHGLAITDKVGIYGWSYGGYMSAMCLARAPETFAAAVAGAPVTAMDGYDTHYTERYMSTPQSNPLGYESSSVMHYVGNITGRLMLVHGLIDENVHFRHTARLINSLIEHRKKYELLLFPDERHMPRKVADRIYMEEQIRDFFIDTLM